jgi:hypothetical protein
MCVCVPESERLRRPLTAPFAARLRADLAWPGADGVISSARAGGDRTPLSSTKGLPRRRGSSRSRHPIRAAPSWTRCPPPDPRVTESIREARSTSSFPSCLRHRVSMRQRSSAPAMSPFSRSRRARVWRRRGLFGGLLVLRSRRDALDARGADRGKRLRAALRRRRLLRRLPTHEAGGREEGRGHPGIAGLEAAKEAVRLGERRSFRPVRAQHQPVLSFRIVLARIRPVPSSGQDYDEPQSRMNPGSGRRGSNPRHRLGKWPEASGGYSGHLGMA